MHSTSMQPVVGPMLRISGIIFVFLLLQSPFAALADADLADWIRGGVLHLPAIAIHSGKVRLDLAQFDCRGMSVRRVHATRINPSRSSAALPPLYGVSFNVAGLGVASCEGNYSATYDASGVAAGAFNFSVVDTDMTVGVLFNGTSSTNPLLFPGDLCGASLHIQGLHFWGSLSGILNDLVPTIENEIALIASEKMCSRLLDPLLAGLGPLLAVMNKAPQEPPASPAVVPASARGVGRKSKPRLVDWRRDVPVLKPLIRGTFGAHQFNNIVNRFTANGSLSLVISQALEDAIGLDDLIFRFNVSDGLFAGYLTDFGIGGVSITGMNRAKNISLVSRDDVTGEYHDVVLDMSASAFGWTAKLSGLRVNMVIDASSDISNPKPLNISGINIATGLRNVLGHATIMLAADYKRMDALTLDGLLDAYHDSGGDLFGALGSICGGIYGINFTNAELAAELCEAAVSSAGSNFYSADSSRQNAPGPGGYLMDDIVDTITTGLIAFLDVKEFRTRLLTNILNYVLPLARPDVNAYVSRLLHNATVEAQKKHAGNGSAVEPRQDLKDVNPADIHMKVAIVAGLATTAIFSYVLLLRWGEQSCCPTGKRQNTAKDIGRNPMDEPLTSPLMSPYASNSPEKSARGEKYVANLGTEKARLHTHMSLASAYAGTWKRLGLPILHVVCASIGAWSLSVPVCDVRIRITGGVVNANKVVLDDSLLVYTFPQMVSDFWRSGSWMIAVLLVAGTAVLPQLKGILSLVVWSVPMEHKQRGYALTFLDIIGRFVLVCQIFIMLVVATLRASIVLPGVASDIVAEPIHSIAGATVGLLSMMLVSQMTIYAHDHAPMITSTKSVHKAKHLADKIRRIPTSMIIVLLITTCVTSFLAITMEILEFQIHGLAGNAEDLPASMMPSVKRISLITLPSTVYADTDQKSVALFAAMALVVFAIAAPLACALGWAVQWCWALCKHTHPIYDSDAPTWIRTVSTMNMYMYSWCALDVVWFSIGASALEMDLVTQWIVQKQPGVGAACNALKEWTGGETQCVKVVGHFTEGSWVLLAAAVTTGTMYSITCMIFGMRQDLTERME